MAFDGAAATTLTRPAREWSRLGEKTASIGKTLAPACVVRPSVSLGHRATRSFTAAAILSGVGRVLVWALVALTLPAGCSGSSRAADAGPPTDGGTAPVVDAGDEHDRVLFDDARASVLTVFPHPDDEVGYAPILGKLCNDLEGHCTMLVLTRGEAGNCSDPAGCEADLGAQRTDEMAAAAALYGARLHHWDWGDGRAREWADLHGGEQALVDRVAEVVAEAAPDIVFLHDPRHGDYCHPDHRAASIVALLAIEQLGIAPRVYLREGVGSPEVRTSFSAEPQPILDDALVYFDATEHLASIDDRAWDYLARTMWLHRSQTGVSSLAELRAFADLPASQQRVYMLRLEDAMEDDSRYQICL